MPTDALATRPRICRCATDGASTVGLVERTGSIGALAVSTVAEGLALAARGALPDAGPLLDARLLAPIDAQEIWGAGVTYERSRNARIAEAGEGARDHYADVYDAARAELFFKAAPHRVVGPGADVLIRSDSKATVPEPELALWLDADLSLLGFGLGNDMTARDLEAENPLYLPQAKIWDASCALGPWVVACTDPAALAGVELSMEILRDGSPLFSGSIGLDAMRRTPAELVEQLGRHTSFPGGAVLLTGTGIVPPDDVNLRPGDDIRIAGTDLGELRTHVAAARQPSPG